jgi:P pilus assembly chaperone PapD
MFEASDFDLPLETELKQRVIFDEVEQCEDVKVLQESLKNVTKLFMRYEHLLHSVIAKQMEKNMHDFLNNYGELKNEQV